MAKLRLLAKKRADNCILIGESSDPCAGSPAPVQRSVDAGTCCDGAVEPVSARGQQDADNEIWCCEIFDVCAENGDEDFEGKCGVCEAIPPLVSLLLSGSNRGKKDALTMLYKLCSMRQNKERAVSVGAVMPLVELVTEQV